MGLQAECVASFEGRVSHGKAQLENARLLFRGDYRVVVSFDTIKRVSEASGKLTIEFDRGILVLDLGTAAGKWEQAIRQPKSLIEKLGLKDGMVVFLHGTKNEDFLNQLKQKNVQVAKRPIKNADIIFFGADSKEELESISKFSKHLAKNGAFWIIYPKGQKELKQDDVFKAGKSIGLVDVKVVSFSSTHTALKFVIPVSRRN